MFREEEYDCLLAVKYSKTHSGHLLSRQRGINPLFRRQVGVWESYYTLAQLQKI
jgi:hypothetical protein